MLRKILRTIAEYGVKELHLINSARVEKSYWQSPLLQPEKIHDALMAGMERSKDTLMTNVHLHKRFRPFIEDQLSHLCATRNCWITDMNAAKSAIELNIASTPAVSKVNLSVFQQILLGVAGCLGSIPFGVSALRLLQPDTVKNTTTNTNVSTAILMFCNSLIFSLQSQIL